MIFIRCSCVSFSLFFFVCVTSELLLVYHKCTEPNGVFVVFTLRFLVSVSGRIGFIGHVNLFAWAPYQFQNGTIISNSASALGLRPPKFQFQDGTIISKWVFRNFDIFMEVSIPRWCDYKNKHKVKINKHFSVSIPRWCDYKH